MPTEITDGHVAAIRLLRSVAARAPTAEKAKYNAFMENGDWDGYLAAIQPLLRKLGLARFTASELGFVAPMSEPQRDVVLFYSDLGVPKLEKLKARVDSLLGWGAWQSAAKLAQAIPKMPFKFDGDDFKRVFSDNGAIPEMTDGQAQAKSFLAAVAGAPNLAELDKRIKTLTRMGGFQSVVELVAENPKIPYVFTADDLQSLVDPGREIMTRPPADIKFLEIWDALRERGKTDEDVQKFFSDLDKRKQKGCWNSISDQLNKLEKFPLKPISAEKVRAALDPSGQHGNDPTCESCAPPPTPGWIGALVWSINAGKDVYNAYEDTKNFTLDATGAVDDWTSGAAGDVADFATGAYDDAADWTSDTMGEGSAWVSDAAGEFADWAQNPEQILEFANREVAEAMNELGRQSEEWASKGGDVAREIGETAEEWGKTALEETEKAESKKLGNP